MKRILSGWKKAAAVLFLTAGAFLACWPLYGRYEDWKIRTMLLENFQSEREELKEEQMEEIMEEAREYNRRMSAGLPQKKNYEQMLNFSRSGIMSIIHIPAIAEVIPIYHGCSASVLSKGAGHLESSSLPVGGEGTHALITAHRGLPSSLLFTRLDELEKGDVFFLETGNEILAYEVEAIQVVEPWELDAAAPQPGRDLVTLATCTPYGINSHRLLVTGSRTDPKMLEEESVEQKTPSMLMQVVNALPWISLTVCLAGCTSLLRKRKYKRNK